MKEIEITHTCGHIDIHNAWGRRIPWLQSKPCRECAGIGPRIIKDPKTMGQIVIEECARAALPEVFSEHRFHPTRRWKFDFAWPSYKVALEVEGSPGMGRHTRAAGFLADCEKYNTAAMLGWVVFRCTRKTVPATIPLLALTFARLEYGVADSPRAQPPLPPTKPITSKASKRQRGRTQTPIRAAGAFGSIP